MVSNKIEITQEIVQRFKDGDEEGFQILYNYFYKKIYFYAFYLLKDKQLAEDIVQNTFLNAYQQRDKLVYLEAFHVWIMRIAAGECKKLLRKNTPETIMDAEVFEQIVAKTDDYKFVEEIVRQEVDKFPTELRSVAVLKYFNEFKETEISDILNIPLGTVKSRLTTIRKKLQKKLQAQEITPKTYRASSVVLPVVLAAVYNGWFDALQNTPAVTKELIATLMKPGTVASGLTISSIISTLLKTAAVTGLLATTIFLGDRLLNHPEKEPEKPLLRDYEEVVVIKTAEIVEVNFDQGYTNQKIEIDVILSNDNYDYYTINGERTDFVTDNGEYLVELYFQEEVVDSESFTITSIDRKEPVLVEHSYSENRIAELIVTDKETNIGKVVIYKDGNAFTDFSLSSDKKVIQFYVEVDAYYEVHVSDLAGNVLKIRVYEEQ